MDSSKCRILLIVSQEDKNYLPLREILLKSNCELLQVHEVQNAINKVIEHSPDLIICHSQVGEKTGLQLFHTLKPELVKRCTPFFIYLPHYQKEDVLIGLEMGVDNFIIYPFDEATVIHKIQHQMEKAERIKVLDSREFQHSFGNSPVAKCIIQNARILKINKAFSRITHITDNSEKLPKLEEVFDFSENETNELLFKKCMNGLKHEGLFQSVSLKNYTALKFDIYLVYTDYFGEELFMAEVVPVSEINGNNNTQSWAEGANGHTVDDSAKKNGVSLTPREKEVLDWSAQGLPIKQIANILHISERTVEKHRANIMSKTEANSIIEAIYAVQRKNGMGTGDVQ